MTVFSIANFPNISYHKLILYDIYICEVITTVIIANYTELPTLLVYITINSQVWKRVLLILHNYYI